ncbi:MAG: hypothetical protein A2V90_05070, partial [Gammaproteobacteria bacterium RBG_16_57_12]
STTAAQGGIILLHDLETHPDWPAVIAPLRKSLPEHGWTVLSVQMPRLPPGAVSDNAAIRQLITEAKPRIQAAVDYLKGKEFKKLALIGHGLGAVQGLAYLTEAGPGEKTILGLVSISGRRPAQAAELLPLREILPALDARIALFDIHAGREGNHGQLDAAGAKRYQPFGILGADYTYRGFELLLTSRVQGWLKKNVVKSTFAEPLPVSKN